MIEHPEAITVDAVVLAGGSGRRMGYIDKPALTVGRKSLVQKAIDAASGARHVVVVGPHRADLAPNILQTRESPAGTGPVAAIAAGLRALAVQDSDIVLVLAADLPFVDRDAVDTLLSALKSHSAAFAVDRAGRTQYLFGAWHSGELDRRIAALPDASNRSVRSIVPDDHVVVELDDVDDCDTVADLDRARERAAAIRPDEPTPTVDRMREDIRRRVRPLAPRTVSPADALGSTLSAPLIASEPLPRVDISAMDGFAVRGADPWTVREDVAFAGTSGHGALTLGDAVRIATGAQVPPGASAVLRDEHVLRDGNRLVRRDGAPTRDDTRRAGEDWAAGTELVSAGTQVSAAVASVALSSEVTALSVRGPVRARIIVSGNEIRREGRLEPGQTRDSIGAVLPIFLDHCGMTAQATDHLEDSPTAFADLLARPADTDVLVVVGATGSGAADQLRTALIRADADMIVRRTGVRPGGSQITAVLPNGTVVLGLPGNPLAAIATVMLTAPAVVDALTTRTPLAPLLGHLSDDGYIDSPVARLVPVERDGTRWKIRPNLRTAHLLHLVDQDAFALIPANVTPGTAVELLLLPR